MSEKTRERADKGVFDFEEETDREPSAVTSEEAARTAKYGRLEHRCAVFRSALAAIVKDISEYLDGTWDGNREGWEAILHFASHSLTRGGNEKASVD